MGGGPKIGRRGGVTLTPLETPDPKPNGDPIDPLGTPNPIGEVGPQNGEGS